MKFQLIHALVRQLSSARGVCEGARGYRCRWSPSALSIVRRARASAFSTARRCSAVDRHRTIQCLGMSNKQETQPRCQREKRCERREERGERREERGERREEREERREEGEERGETRDEIREQRRAPS